MYGKFVDGVFKRAPRRISEEEARAQGYKPIVLTPAPDTDEAHLPEEWLEKLQDEIVRHWNIVPVPVEPEDIDEVEAWEIIFGGGAE